VLAALFCCALACDTQPSSMPNPLLRADLASQLPEGLKVRKLAAIELDCTRQVELGKEGARQQFVVNWRVLDIDGVRYIAAVDVAPKGGTSGATAASATATVGQVKRQKAGGKTVDELQVTLHWQAKKGCSSLSETRSETVRSDDGSCKAAQPKGLLKPAKAPATAPAKAPATAPAKAPAGSK